MDHWRRVQYRDLVAEYRSRRVGLPAPAASPSFPGGALLPVDPCPLLEVVRRVRAERVAEQAKRDEEHAAIRRARAREQAEAAAEAARLADAEAKRIDAELKRLGLSLPFGANSRNPVAEAFCFRRECKDRESDDDDADDERQWCDDWDGGERDVDSLLEAAHFTVSGVELVCRPPSAAELASEAEARRTPLLRALLTDARGGFPLPRDLWELVCDFADRRVTPDLPGPADDEEEDVVYEFREDEKSTRSALEWYAWRPSGAWGSWFRLRDARTGLDLAFTATTGYEWVNHRHETGNCRDDKRFWGCSIAMFVPGDPQVNSRTLSRWPVDAIGPVEWRRETGWQHETTRDRLPLPFERFCFCLERDQSDSHSYLHTVPKFCVGVPDLGVMYPGLSQRFWIDLLMAVCQPQPFSGGLHRQVMARDEEYVSQRRRERLDGRRRRRGTDDAWDPDRPDEFHGEEAAGRWLAEWWAATLNSPAGATLRGMCVIEPPGQTNAVAPGLPPPRLAVWTVAQS